MFNLNFIWSLSLSLITNSHTHYSDIIISNHQLHDCLLNRLFRRRSKKHQSSALLAFVRGIHRWPVNSPHKGPVTLKLFPFDDIIMYHPLPFGAPLLCPSHYPTCSSWKIHAVPWSADRGQGHHRAVGIVVQYVAWKSRTPEKDITLYFGITSMLRIDEMIVKSWRC